MWDEFQSLLDGDRNDGKLNALGFLRIEANRADLTRMYGLLMRIPNGLEPLRKRFEEHVKKSGMAAVQKVIPTPGASADGGKAEALVSLQERGLGSETQLTG